MAGCCRNCTCMCTPGEVQNARCSGSLSVSSGCLVAVMIAEQARSKVWARTGTALTGVIFAWPNSNRSILIKTLSFGWQDFNYQKLKLFSIIAYWYYFSKFFNFHFFINYFLLRFRYTTMKCWRSSWIIGCLAWTIRLVTGLLLKLFLIERWVQNDWRWLLHSKPVNLEEEIK